MKIVLSFNDHSEENLKAYPFYVGYNSGVVIDQRVREVDGENVLDDLYVVTSGLPIKSKDELALFLKDFADSLLELEDDNVS